MLQRVKSTTDQDANNKGEWPKRPMARSTNANFAGARYLQISLKVDIFIFNDHNLNKIEIVSRKV